MNDAERELTRLVINLYQFSMSLSAVYEQRYKEALDNIGVLRKTSSEGFQKAYEAKLNYELVCEVTSRLEELLNVYH